MRESLILKKKQKLRNNEYYNIQDKFDDLYNEATKGREFNKLMDIIRIIIKLITSDSVMYDTIMTPRVLNNMFTHLLILI